MSGRELSVVDAFQAELFQACRRHAAVDLKISLNGADRVFNADTMFSSNGHFFLVEFKSSLGELKSEDRKPSACILCEGLFQYPKILELHQQCHFAMWGKKLYNGGLETVYGVYEDLVCRAETLPLCEGVWPVPNHRYAEANAPMTWKASNLAERAAKSSAGLDRESFLHYLEWLLWTRGGDGKTSTIKALPIVLFGTSLLGGVTSMPFTNFQSLEAWAQPFIDKRNQQGATPDSEKPLSPNYPSDDEIDPDPEAHKPRRGPGPR